MKLRHRLFLFSTGQLVVFGVLSAIAFVAFKSSVIPMFEGFMRDKSEAATRVLGGELDIALGAEDPKLMASKLDSAARDPDLSYVAVRDAHGITVASRGTVPQEDVFAGPDSVATIGSAEIWSWKPISLEGLHLGSVAVVFSTARLARLERWAGRLAFGVIALWLLAVGYAISFARSFVTPIRAMMDFSRKVAGGAMSDRLDVEAPGELRDLRDHLNEMTADLQRREHARQLAATRAEDMQRELLSVTRMAGMAEIATGVLHNVGNVLNSLNVSVSVIGDQVRNSRIAALSKSVELFDEFPGGLPAFLDTDRGKVLPGYLASVSKHLVAENTSMLSELDAVTRNVDHIKSIVAMQQSYARPLGVSEPVALAELIDDALRLGESLFAKHGIAVVKDYPPQVRVTSDRHKLLQILINLISNARHALKDAPHGDLRLIVKVRATATGATIEIADNGIGIPAENLPKIFQHGFTTKKGGHGFGLHASAIATRELGGTLVATSDGPGSGATFTLDVPSEPKHDHVRHN